MKEVQYSTYLIPADLKKKIKVELINVKWVKWSRQSSLRRYNTVRELF